MIPAITYGYTDTTLAIPILGSSIIIGPIDVSHFTWIVISGNFYSFIRIGGLCHNFDLLLY